MLPVMTKKKWILIQNFHMFCFACFLCLNTILTLTEIAFDFSRFFLVSMFWFSFI